MFCECEEYLQFRPFELREFVFVWCNHDNTHNEKADNTNHIHTFWSTFTHFLAHDSFSLSLFFTLTPLPLLPSPPDTTQLPTPPPSL